MKKVLEASLLFRFITAASLWLDRQWDKSYMAKIFTEMVPRKGDGSVFGKVFNNFHKLFHRLFQLLRLDRAAEGSVFTRTFFFCALTVTLAPILPTMAVLGLAILAIGSALLRSGMSMEEKLPYSPMTKWIMLYAAVYGMCTFTSVDVMGSLQGGALTVAFVLFSLTVLYSVRRQRQLETLIGLMVAAGFVVALCGFYQVLTGVESTEAWVDKTSFSDVTLRVYSTLENPNVLGEYLLLVIPLGAACTVNAKSVNGKLYGAIATLAMIVCMVLTLSRGGWLGLIFAAALFLVLLDKRLILLGVVGLMFMPLVLPQSIIDRFASITDLSDSSTSYRLYIWMATVNMLKDYWFCGVGTGYAAYNAVYPRYGFNTVVAPHSHNLYLQIMCECGIGGILVFAGVIITYLRTVGTAARKAVTKKRRIYLLAMISGLGGFLLQGITDYSFYNYRVMLMFWVYMALGAAAALVPEERGSVR